MVFGGRLFAEDGLIHDTGNGRVVGRWPTAGLPTWSGATGVAYGSNKLRGFGPSYEATRWEFGIDAYTDLSLPLIAGSHVYTSTTDWSPYALMALRLSDGARVWCQDTPTGFPPEPVAAGHGLLIVIHGHALATYESGGPPSDCTASPVSRSSHAPQPPAPRLQLTVARRNLLLGQRTKVVVRLSGLPNPGGRAITIDIDPWPFDGKFKRAARGTTARDGTVAFSSTRHAASGGSARARRASRCVTRVAGWDPATDGWSALASESPTPSAARTRSIGCAVGAPSRVESRADRPSGAEAELQDCERVGTAGVERLEVGEPGVGFGLIDVIEVAEVLADERGHVAAERLGVHRLGGEDMRLAARVGEAGPV
jgi:hypothetical protein